MWSVVLPAEKEVNIVAQRSEDVFHSYEQKK